MRIVIIFLLLLGVVACNDKAAKQENDGIKTVTVALKPITTDLHYISIVEPIRIEHVVTPVDGNIISINFKYGHPIKTNDILLTIKAERLKDEYRSAITGFLEKKANYLNEIEDLQGIEELNKAGILSRQEYTNAKQQYENSALAYINARYTLEKVISKLPSINVNIEELTAHLSFTDLNQIQKILQTESDNIDIIAKASGIALFPTISFNNARGEANKQLQVGSEVKAEQQLLMIGDLSGITTTVQVNEFDINHLKPGQEVAVTFSAIAKKVMRGYIRTVGSQTQSGDNGARLAMFPVTIDVPTIPASIKKLIRVGMSTKVTITLKDEPQITVPISTVFDKNNINMVTIVDPNTHKPKEVAVEIGQTTQSEIVIKRGLKVGDQVIFRD